nr:MAG TPA: hypothetical protein [Myoviridae sp. ctPCN11]
MTRLTEILLLLNLTLMKLRRPFQQIPTLNYLRRNILSLSSRQTII